MKAMKLILLLFFILSTSCFAQVDKFTIKVKAKLKIKQNKQVLKITIKTSEPRDFDIYEDYSSLVDPIYLGHLYFYDSLVDVYERHSDSSSHYRFIESYPELLFPTEDGYYRYFIYDTLDLSAQMRRKINENNMRIMEYSFKEPTKKEKWAFDLSIHPKILEIRPKTFIYRDNVYFQKPMSDGKNKEWLSEEGSESDFIQNLICIQVESKIRYSLIWRIKNQLFSN